ncbi:MAG: type II toxin-antitoxin system RelE/ParE family toxin [Proteobacteria bacterium]|nr:type II toxin-antitoxin system RelE/ParE family toxin [Desulfobulbaceae bacterium]MBU4151555.1 type II toxin-antitoxin system RelE/ParE family toxin [Pseudomonadota bacterium]
MSTSFKVHWASIAEDDFKNIILYIEEDSPSNARNIFEKIKETALILTHFPESGRIVPELQDQGIFLYRELILAPWRIVYRISDNKVYVLLVIDSRQNVEDILLKRLIR